MNSPVCSSLFVVHSTLFICSYLILLNQRPVQNYGVKMPMSDSLTDAMPSKVSCTNSTNLRFKSLKQTTMKTRVRPKLGFSYGFGAETAKFLGFGYGRNSHFGFGLVSVTAVTRNLVSA